MSFLDPIYHYDSSLLHREQDSSSEKGRVHEPSLTLAASCLCPLFSDSGDANRHCFTPAS